MKNPQITHKITQGMYILTVPGGGCVVDAVMRAGNSQNQPLIAVSVAKHNHSNQLLHEQDKFALSILGENADPALISTFGFQSGRDTDKYANTKTLEVAGVPVIKDSLGYMVMDKIDTIEGETHTTFIGRLIEGDILQDGAQPMTYTYYQAHKAELTASDKEAIPDAKVSDAASESQEDLTRTTTEQGKTAWVCTVCGYVYYGDEVPDDYRCPLCGLGKAYFKQQA